MKMKGMVMGWVVIITVISMGIFAAVWTSKVTGTDRTIVDRSSDVVSVVNAAEAVRSLLNPSVEQLAQKTAYDFAANSLGEDNWDTSRPNEIKSSLEKEIRKHLPIGGDSVAGKSLMWLSNNFEIVSTDDASFNVKGKIEYSVEDVSVKSIVKLEQAFDIPIQSTFFKLTKVGRNLLEGETWTVSKSAIDSTKDNECKQKVSALSGDPYVLTTSDFLRFAFQCGYKNDAGLASLDKYDAIQTAALANSVAKALESDLAQKYDLEFHFSPLISQSGQNAEVKVKTSIIDKQSPSPTNPNEFLNLIFNNQFTVNYP